MSELRKFMVVGTITISVHTDVEARDEEEAIEIAVGRPVMSLCHQCARGDSNEEWATSGELDGEPCDLRVEDAS